MIKRISSRIAAVGSAAVLASCLMAPAAFADVAYDDDLGYWYDNDRNLYLNSDLTDGEALDETADEVLLGGATTDSRPRAAATRAAMPAAEMLGLAGVEEQGAFSTILNFGTYYQPVLSWTQPKYMFFATDLSSQPSPYLVNFAAHTGSNMAMYNPSREGGGAGPNATLDQAGGDTTDDNVWSMAPDVIIGDGGKTDDVLRTWHSGYDENNYVTYNVSNYTAMMQTATDIETAVAYRANSQGYSNLDVASVHDNVSEFNAFITRMQNSATGSTVALVLDYDVDTHLYTLGLSSTPSGTATQNRYLEAALWAGATNIYDTLGTTTVDGTALSGADLILVGGQQGTSHYSNVMKGLWNDQLLDNAYFVVNDATNVGAAYGYVMNSFDNAQNLARILPYINGGDQRAEVESFFENFYHIDPDYIDYVLENTLDGCVRNWDVAPDYDLSLELNIANMTAW